MSQTGYEYLNHENSVSQEGLSPGPYDHGNNTTNSSHSPTFKVISQQPISNSFLSEPYFTTLRRYNSQPDETQPLLSSSLQNTSPLSLQNDHHLTTRERKPSFSRSLMSLDLRTINEKVSKWTQSLFSSAANKKVHEIQYSVFKPPQNIRPLARVPPEGFIDAGPITREQFDCIVRDAIGAINQWKPHRIKAGSSGSYFIYSSEGSIVGVFKPKDEEPYGPLSPKWTKWLHRNLFPCFFGRSCLIPNLGYICESAASLLDCQLQTYMIPYTGVVSLSSDSFYYSYWDRRSKKQLPAKIGSFQLFLNGYMEADKFLAKYPLPGSRWALPGMYYTYNGIPGPCGTEPEGVVMTQDDTDIDLDGTPEFRWTPPVIQQFREELEKLVILDYIMRNTDRGLDNWMIKVEWEVRANGKKHPVVKIGVIDSGLSFPWKHPDEWRSYPFGWLFLPVSIIGQPFSQKTRNHFLPLLTSTKWWENSSLLFRDLFEKDSDFKERMWRKQWSVVKGQAFNVVESLKDVSHGPLELARCTRMLVYDQEMEVSVRIPISMMKHAMNTPLYNPHQRITKGGKSPPQFPHSSANLDSIDEDETDGYLHQREEDDEELQRHWNDLLNGDINEDEFQSTKAQKRSINSPADAGNPLESAFVDPSATKGVIIEKIHAVTSKPPVFTCC